MQALITGGSTRSLDVKGSFQGARNIPMFGHTGLVKLAKADILELRQACLNAGFTSTGRGITSGRQRFINTNAWRMHIPQDNEPLELTRYVGESIGEVRVFSGFMGESGWVGIGTVVVAMSPEQRLHDRLVLPYPSSDHGIVNDTIRTEGCVYCAVVVPQETAEATIRVATQLAGEVARFVEGSTHSDVFGLIAPKPENTAYQFFI